MMTRSVRSLAGNRGQSLACGRATYLSSCYWRKSGAEGYTGKMTLRSSFSLGLPFYTPDWNSVVNAETRRGTGSTTPRYKKAGMDGVQDGTTRLSQDSTTNGIIRAYTSRQRTVRQSRGGKKMGIGYTRGMVKREREKIRESKELSEKIRKLLLECDEAIIEDRGPNDRFGLAREYTVLSHLRLIAERTNRLADVIIHEDNTAKKEAAKNAGKEIVKHIKRRFRNGFTRDTKIGCVRVFIDLVGNPDLIPDFSDVFKANYSKHEDSTPAPGTILRWEDDVVPMIDATSNERDKAMVALQWASGCRPMSELIELEYRQVVDRGDYFIVTTSSESKTGERDVRVFVGAPYLRDWLQNHPADDEGGFQPDTPIWTHHNKNEQLSYGRYADIFDELANKSGLSKPSNPQHFRASRASILASRSEVSQADLENHFGWIRGSNAAAHYVSRFGKATARHIAKADGVVVEADVPDDSVTNSVSLDTKADGPIAPVRCPNCNEWTPRHRETCLWCPSETTVDEAAQTTSDRVTPSKEAREARTDFIKMVTNGELSTEDIETMEDVADAISEFPGLFDHIEELRAHLNN